MRQPLLWLVSIFLVCRPGPSSAEPCVDPSQYYVHMFFGEKSGFDEGFAAYEVAKVLAENGLTLRTCDGHHIVGPYDVEYHAEQVAGRIAGIGVDRQWLHFYTSVKRGAGIIAPSSAAAPPSIGQALRDAAGLLLAILVFEWLATTGLMYALLKAMKVETSFVVMALLFLFTPIIQHASHLVPVVGFLIALALLLLLYSRLFRSAVTHQPLGCVSALGILLVRSVLHYLVLVICLAAFAKPLLQTISRALPLAGIR